MPEYTAIYLRVSTDHQTIEQQENAINMLLMARGLTATDENVVTFREDGRSATKYPSLQDRPEGKKLWKMMQDGIVERLIVIDFDRLWRNGITGVVEANQMLEMGVDILCAAQSGMPLDLGTADGFKAFWNKMGDAQAECMRTSERVSRKQDYNLSIGQAITGTVYGWEKDEWGNLNPNYEQQAVIEWVKKNMANGTRSQQGMAVYLNNNGIPTASGGGKWRNSSVARIVKSRTQIALGPTVQARYVSHPKLGRIRIGQGKNAVTAQS